ncbi:STAS domain-containing protein [Psychromonas aquimarina]|uniref:STAS domain-containing protein n=1 Tax=Psychromonas aquimarina TaxID=444919 RepID=UPI00048AC359|nr:STAS domain-containing protein [Psychromonas aquimarina]
MNIERFDTAKNNLMVKLSGEMDALGCSKIRPNLEEITTQNHHHIILDISSISFIDSSGIGAIVFLFKRLKEQGRSMEITGVQGQPQELMTLLRIDCAIPLTPAITPDAQQETIRCAH